MLKVRFVRRWLVDRPLPDGATADHWRWKRPEFTWGNAYPERAEHAASLVPAGARVLDLGAGSMVLRRYLQPNVRYTSADIIKRDSDTIIVDLNKQEFPPGEYDWIVALGVLVYIRDVAWVLRQCAAAAPNLLFTYRCYDPADDSREERLVSGKVSHLTRQDAEETIRAAGYTTVSAKLSRRVSPETWFVCQR